MRAVLVICSLQLVALFGILTAISEHRQEAGAQLLYVSSENLPELSPVIQLADFAGITVQRREITANSPNLNYTSAQLVSDAGNLTDLHMIGQHVAGLAEQKRKLQQSIVAPLSILCFTLLCWLYPTLGMAVSFLSPITLGIASIAIGTSCITCGGTTIKGLLLGPGIFLLSILSLIVLWNAKLPSTVIQRLFPCVCLAAIAVQVGLILSFPVFCVWCVIVAVGIVANIVSTQPNLKAQPVRLYSPPPLLVKTTASCIVIGIFLHTTMAMGLRNLSVEPLAPQFLPKTGEAVVRYLRSPFTTESAKNRTFILTLPTCPSCADVKRVFAENTIPFVEVQPCSIFNTSRCFDAGSASYRVPMILTTDNRASIKFVQVGWPDNTAEVQALINLIKDSDKSLRETQQ